MFVTLLVTVLILAHIQISSSQDFPLKYSANGIFTVYGTNATDPPSSSTMQIFRDSVQNKTLFKYDLGSWAKAYGWKYHVDVIREENGKLIDYFWYLTYDDQPVECVYNEWDGSSYRTFFYQLSILPESADQGSMTARGAKSDCWTNSIPNYGNTEQCFIYVDNEIYLPWVFQGISECCPGANRWDFADFNTNVTFQSDFFDVPTNCTPRDISMRKSV